MFMGSVERLSLQLVLQVVLVAAVFLGYGCQTTSARHVTAEQRLAAAITSSRTARHPVVLTITEDIVLTKPLPVILGSILIKGACGRRKCVVDGAGKYAIFRAYGSPAECSVTIEHLILRNAAESAYNGKCNVRLKGVVFKNNRDRVGGAVAVGLGAATWDIEDCLFEGNSAPGVGGALLVSAWGRGRVARTVFKSNRAGEEGGAVIVYAQPINKAGYVFDQVTFDSNTAGKSGGGMFIAGSTQRAVTVVVSGCKFTKNVARGGYGGGLALGWLMDARICHTSMAGGGNKAKGGQGNDLALLDGNYSPQMTVTFCPAKPIQPNALSLFVTPVSHDLVATCALQQEEILHLQQTVDQMLARLQALEKQPDAVAAAGPSTLTTRVQVLDDDVNNIKRVHQDFRTSQQATNLQLETQVQAAATVTPAAASSRRPPKLDDIPVFCDQSKMELIPWWRQFTLRIDMHHDNILTSHGVAVSELHTKLTWQELTDAWHKRFQVEPPDLQAMDKLNKLHQNTLLSQDWITEFQRLASTPNLPLAFRAIKHLFIMRSCLALQNALTQIAETLDTSNKLFSTASRIILTNIEARNAGRSSATTSGTQPKPKVACITSTEAATPNEGEVLAAARDGGRPQQSQPRQDEDSVHLYTEHRISRRRTLGTIRTPGEFLSHETQVPLLPLVQQHHPRCCTLPHQGETPSEKVGAAEGDSTPPSTPSEAVVCTIALSSEAYGDVRSLPFSFEDFAVRLVPSLDPSQGQDTCAAFLPSEGSYASSPSSRDSASVFNEEALDPLTPEDFAWIPLPTTGNLPGPQSAALCALLHQYLSFNAPPTLPTVDEVAVEDMLGYVAKVAREFVSQRQSFMTRNGLGAQVRRKSHPTTVALADGKTKQLLDHYISAVPMYFAPHACEPVTFDVLDTDFDVILGKPWLSSADHTVNFHRRTLTIRDATGAEVPCTIPPPRSSIRCQVVSAKSFRDTYRSEHVEEIGIALLRTVPTTDSSSTEVSSAPRVTRLLDEFSDVFVTPSGIIPDRPISHEIILEAGAVPPKGCIYHMSEEELTVLCAQLDDLLDKGWIRPSSSPYGAPVLFVRKKNKDLRL
ncbi:hypothetical protein CBR_g2892 [Chara braunii]|uniref:Reverse transcriptase domain-containing protein n=1 Tax=Chara braunii TaxID=69332 RepID=A0A388KE67_CHABU|nr:hypothetical protein CBR_g2892 [Chara braunii]|eukprot:GBG68348.1 hypothetical protein CBR_g2892 [Chara braunii]